MYVCVFCISKVTLKGKLANKLDTKVVSVGVWGCISASGVGDIVRIADIKNADKGRQILIHHAILPGKHLIGNCFIYFSMIINQSTLLKQ